MAWAVDQVFEAGQTFSLFVLRVTYTQSWIQWAILQRLERSILVIHLTRSNWHPHLLDLIGPEHAELYTLDLLLGCPNIDRLQLGVVFESNSLHFGGFFALDTL